MHLVVLFGPPAVGKMTVGHELCRLTGYRLFHNHLTIEPFLEVFEFGSPSFVRLSSEFRRRVVEEAIASDLPGLVFTFVWGLELEEDRDFVQAYVDLVEGAAGRVSFVELAAPLAIRQERNNTEFRLAEKKSKRDRAFNDANLVELESYVMNTGVPTPADVLLAGHPHLRLDNSALPAAEAARQVTAWLDQLPASSAATLDSP
jgi:hypothetical protein